MSGDRNGEYGEFPKDFLGKKKRSTGQKVGIGCGAALVGFVVLGAIGAIIGDPKADGDRTQSATGNSAAPVATASTSTDAAAKAELQGQVKALWQSVIAQSTRCDEAANRVAAAGKTGDMYTIYPAANDGHEVCMDAKIETDKLDPPEAAEGDVEDAFEKAIEECGAGHGMRALAFQQLAAIADGDARPSKLTEVKETMEIAGRANLTCVAGFYEAVGKAKLDQKVLDLK